MKLAESQMIQRQSLPLEAKISMSLATIRKWVKFCGRNCVSVSFSAGIDSTVLINLVRVEFPETVGVFCDTGMEYPEIKEFARSIDNVVTVKPKIPFHKVIEKYGWPVISKDQACALGRYQKTKLPEQKYYRMNGFPNGKKGMISKKWQYLADGPFQISEKCCEVIKKNPMLAYEKLTGQHPFIGMRAEESDLRKRYWAKHGCNAYNLKHPLSNPLMAWKKQDILRYLKLNNLPYASIYGDLIEKDGELFLTGAKGTGCMFCGFGAHVEDQPNRFQRMEKEHPKHYNYIINKLGAAKIFALVGIPYKNKQQILDFGSDT